MKLLFGRIFFGGGLLSTALGMLSFMANDPFFNAGAPEQVTDFVMHFWALTIGGGILAAILGARLLK